MVEVISYIFVAFVIYLNVVATIHLVRSDMYSSGQKVAQLALIWLIPIIGAAFVVMLLMEEACAEKRNLRGNSFIIRFLMLSFIFSNAAADGDASEAIESSDIGGFDSGGGGDGGGGD
ncbi:MAG: hypothetical protein N0C88_17255 [Candidatus Thiodiazotropha lotti]|uniref:Uncharacterized protein n=1 Tax=Candidatus Thiodiazotropha lotti TaxID=2792787 RepID=A0A9E4N1P0_9GAMM|nr:hypothetical protein [Candidatus Thiodiazotropha lotti]MCW4205051.1 hypothetical protein [Candidatus Thiodiazotropha lotti]